MPRRLLPAAKVGVSLGLLWYLSQRVDIGAVGERLVAASSVALGELGFLIVVQAGLLVVRWRLVTIRSGENLPLSACVSNICMGLLLNQVLLSAIGGDAVRVMDLIRRKIGVERAATLIFVDRISALLGMTLLIAATIPAFFWRDDPTGRLAAAGGALAPVALGGVAGLCLLLALERPPLVRFLGGPGRMLARFWGALRRVLADWRAGPLVLGLALLVHGVTAANVFVVAQAFGVAVSFGDCLMLAPPVFLLATLPLSVGGWGVREGGFVLAFALVGVGEADALALSISAGLLAVAQGVVGGAVWAVTDFFAGRGPLLDGGKQNGACG